MSRHYWAHIVILLTILGSAGCSSASDDLKDRGVLDVMEQAGEDEYEPPEDALLTEKQVEMYIAVRKRALEMAGTVATEAKKSVDEAEEAEESGSGLGSFMKGMEALKDLGNLVTVDLRAAQQLGYNSAEYQWVKSQVMLAQLQTQADEMMEGLAESLGTSEQPEEDAEAQVHRTNAELLKPYLEQIKELDQKMNEATQQ